MTWEEVAYEDWHGEPVGYNISYWRISTGEEVTWEPIYRTLQVNHDKREVIITGLRLYSEYKMYVRAYTVVGMGPESEVVIGGKNGKL